MLLIDGADSSNIYRGRHILVDYYFTFVDANALELWVGRNPLYFLKRTHGWRLYLITDDKYDGCYNNFALTHAELFKDRFFDIINGARQLWIEMPTKNPVLYNNVISTYNRYLLHLLN
jgi:hypothetical protein